MPLQIYPLKDLNAIRDRLLLTKQTVAVAESVTSGHLQAAFSLADNARLFYQGGVTAYNLGQKCMHLRVEPIHALECDCVSERISAQMATSVCALFRSEYGIAITGYAARVPERDINTLFAYYAISAGTTILQSGRINAPDGDALQTQLFFTTELIQRFRTSLIG